MTRSLRLQLLIATSLATAGLLALFGVAIFIAMRHQLLADYDASLLARAQMLAGSVEQHGNRLHIEIDPREIAASTDHGSPTYFELWANGIVILRSDSLGDADLPGTDAEATANAGQLILPGTRDRTRNGTVSGTGGGIRGGRAAVLTFTPNVDDEGEPHSSTWANQRCILAVAGVPLEAERTLRYLASLLVAACAGAIALSGAVLLGVVSRGIRPVKILARDIERVRESNLSFRLKDRGVPTELLPIVGRLNDLLGRLEEAFSREKSFTADVAYELRTPLAGLITTLEVCRSRRRNVIDYEAAIDDCRLMMDRMQAMMENLFLLSRADSGHLSIRRENINVCELMREMWTMFEHRAEAKQLDVTWSIAPDICVESDVSYLRIVLQNLFDNAISHVNHCGSVRFATEIHGRTVIVVIVNTGSAVAASDVGRVFDRFWRADQSRTDTGVHSGLGMSLSQRLIGLLNGQIKIASSVGGAFTASLLLPAGKDQKDHAAADLPAPRGQLV